METELFLFPSEVALEFPKWKIQEQEENTDGLCCTEQRAGVWPTLLQILSFGAEVFHHEGQMKIVLDLCWLSSDCSCAFLIKPSL